MEHHPLSMSNWPAWEQCPCKQSGGPETAEAKGGTRSHLWLAYLIGRYNGEDVPQPEGVSSDERARAEWAFGEIAAIFGSYSFRSESRVTISGLGVLDGIFGTSDIYAVLPDRIVVADYKTFSNNACDLMAQPMGYGIAIASNDPFAPKLIECIILHGGSREVERRTFTVDEAVARAQKLVGDHLQHREDTSRACPNHFCQYCAKLSACPATDRSLAAVQDGPKFMSLPLAQQLVIAKQVKSICERVEKNVKQELDRQIEEGAEVESASVSADGVSWHYKLKPGTDVLNDILGLANEVANHGIDQTTLVSLASISKTKLCDCIVGSNPGMKVAEAKRIIKPFYAPGKSSKWLERVA